MQSAKNLLLWPIRWFSAASILKKVITLVIIGGIIWFGYGRYQAMQKKQPTLTTAQAEKGTLVTSISASGTITAGNSVAITTDATGVVDTVYVKEGDQVTQGQKIADLTLDQNAKQQQAAAYATYMSAVSAQTTAEQNKVSLDADMWAQKQNVLTAQNAEDYKNNNTVNPQTNQPYTVVEMMNADSALIQARKAFDAAEKKVLESDVAINTAKAQVASTWLAYQQLSSVVTAPATGTITGLTLTSGLPITNTNGSTNSSSSNSSSSTTSSSSSQSFGTITMAQKQTQATVNLSEIDVVKVTVGQKVTLTLDAFPNQTFTGKVAAININGIVSSGVTTYPTTIVFDSPVDHMYPNMAVSAKIITNVKDNVVLVPSAAVQNANGQTSVRIIRNGQIINVPVAVGDANDTQTEIISGIAEGDIVVTGGGIPSGTRPQTGGTSPFSAFGNRGFGGGSNAGRQVFIQR